MRREARCLIFLVAGTLGCESFTEVLGPVPYRASLTGAAVKPLAVTTGATGELTAALDPKTLRWSYTIGWNTLSSAPTGVHLHGPADDTEVAEVLADLNNEATELTPTSAATGVLDFSSQITLTVSGDSLRKLLNSGLVYVDVHTVNNTDGEIRGQIHH